VNLFIYFLLYCGDASFLVRDMFYWTCDQKEGKQVAVTVGTNPLKDKRASLVHTVTTHRDNETLPNLHVYEVETEGGRLRTAEIRGISIYVMEL
jgi:hypothetical protein